MTLPLGTFGVNVHAASAHATDASRLYLILAMVDPILVRT
jgi:hypothetical protein